MRRLILLLAAVPLLAAACAGDQPVDEELLRADPERLLQQGAAAMQELRSYRIKMTVGEGAPPIIIECARPDRYHFRSPVGAADDSETAVYETIVAGGRSYTRECAGGGGDCGDWRVGEAPAVAVFGPSPSYLPGWPIVALEMAAGPENLAAEKIDGDTLTRVQASVNHLRAIFENERRVFTAAGITTFSNECFAEPDGEETCRDLGYEETLEQQEPTLSFYDQRPSTMDVWIDPETFLVHRIHFDVPPHDDPFAPDRPSGETAVLIDYSAFNDVTIEEPH